MTRFLDEMRVDLAIAFAMLAALLSFPGAVLGFVRDVIGV